MNHPFEIIAETIVDGTPEQVYDAVTAETSAWLFPTEGMAGVELIEERPTHHKNRLDGPDGWYNQLEQLIEARPEGTFIRWIHSGVMTDDWEAQYDGASRHTTFYLHTLGQYVAHFAGRPVTFADIQAPPASTAAGSFDRVRDALGITPQTAAGDTVTVDLPGAGPTVFTVDWNADVFLGLRGEDALYRFFGRDSFGATVGLTVHDFSGAETPRLEGAWRAWFDELFA
ncbi:SRPBCC domain-containing protein [Galbitalea soli]|uniref:SRPBCC domain-containing protein n=1 Tax=Galbitalea soli TaxID=1268042 RepID=A0A7C9TRL0_9MICO|nr:SRPBCC domain-containing protein [Galbitalea soli]NYJ30095.1 hypothetical protein [Galbitalea soli]